MNVNIVELNEVNRKELNIKLKTFEKKLSHPYPLDNDYFNISHGENYYAFFDRLGDLHMNILEDKGEIVGTACGMLRNIVYNDKQKCKVWYLGDLKISPEYRGKFLPFKMLTAANDKLKLSNKIYGITMNGKTENKIVRLAKKIPTMKFEIGPTLMIYSMDYKTFNAKNVQNVIKKYRGDFGYTSLCEIKDLILQSTNLPMKILHLNWNDNDKNNNVDINNINDINNYTIMFCCPNNDSMYDELIKNNVTTDITAMIIHHNMYDCNWNFILTSDI
jgi:hypothetical protein